MSSDWQQDAKMARITRERSITHASADAHALHQQRVHLQEQIRIHQDAYQSRRNTLEKLVIQINEAQSALNRFITQRSVELSHLNQEAREIDRLKEELAGL